MNDQNKQIENSQHVTKIHSNDINPKIKRKLEISSSDINSKSNVHINYNFNINLKFISKDTFIERKSIKLIDLSDDIKELFKEAEKHDVVRRIPLTKILKRKLKITDLIIFILIVINISCTIIQNYFTISNSQYNIRISIRFINIFLIIIIDILLILRYYYKYKRIKSSMLAGNNDNFKSTKVLLPFIFELIILSIFSVPNVDVEVTDTSLITISVYNIDSILLIIVYMKIYYILRIYSHFSIFTSSKTKEVSNHYKENAGTGFAIKCLLNNNPMFLLSFTYCLLLILISFLIRSFDFINRFNTSNTPKDLSEYFWIIIVTMMTLGYGDYVPASLAGRLIAFVSGLIGMILITLTIAFVSKSIELNTKEKKVIIKLEKFDNKKKMLHHAKEVVRIIVNMNYIKNYKPKRLKYPIQPKNQYKHKQIGRFLVFFSKLQAHSKLFYHYHKKFKMILVPVEEVFSSINFSIHRGSKLFQENTLIANKMTALVKSINTREIEIQSGLENIENLQSKISNFLIQYNNINSKKK